MNYCNYKHYILLRYVRAEVLAGFLNGIFRAVHRIVNSLSDRAKRVVRVKSVRVVDI